MARVKFGIFEGGARGGRATLNEAKVSLVAKKVGDAVSKGDVCAVIENDKTQVDLCAPVSGTIAELFFKADEEWNKTGEEKTEHGTLFLPALGTIETGNFLEKVQQAEQIVMTLPQLIEEFDKTPPLSTPQRAEIVVPASDVRAPTDEGEDSPIKKASPAARYLARKHDIDLFSVSGTGPEGLVQVTDVEKAIGIISLPLSSSPPTTANVEEKDSHVLVLKPSRESRTLATNLERGSKSVIAGGEIECVFPWFRPMQTYGKPLFKEFAGVPFRPWAVIAYVAMRVLRKKAFWLLNGYWKEEEDRSKDTVNLYTTAVHMGISYDSGEPAHIDEEKGTISGSRLKILTIRDAHALSLKEFMVSLEELLARAKEGTMTVQDISPHTFIVNNIGALGFKRGQSLLPPYISGLLNVGAVNEAGETVLGLFFDHRMCDGRLVGRFLHDVVEETNTLFLNL